jgi:hypothetical protein
VLSERERSKLAVEDSELIGDRIAGREGRNGDVWVVHGAAGSDIGLELGDEGGAVGRALTGDATVIDTDAAARSR